MAVIRMRDMEFYGFTGCLPEEKINGQRFIINVTMTLDGLGGFVSDRLEDTVDYSAVYEIVKAETESSHCDLIEHLAYVLAGRILGFSEKISEVTVSVSKPDAPIDGKFGTMEAEVTLHA